METKSEKQKCMESIPGEWKKLSFTGTMEFQNILRILNRYYDAFTATKEKSATQKFREEISYLPESRLEIYTKRFGKYEYLIYCEVIEDGARSRSDTWIHIDGIAEERDMLHEKTIQSHPVYNIVCMRDIFDGHTESVGEKNMVV